MERIVFPFTAVLGQEKIKNAIIWNLVNPKIGGVLISGEKGTAKSTLVRGIAEISASMKVIELPLNVTEDRLVGSINLKAALQSGKRESEPGILKDADGNILYVDEVNLLSDHIVNALLDAASSGINALEREGIFARHSSRFILIGSMNPEEGKLRPGLLDRFGLYVDAEAEKAVDTRIEIMRQRLAFERNVQDFTKRYADDTARLRQRICSAIEYLPRVRLTDNALALAASLASQLNCSGHRGELSLVETAKSIAALDSRRALNSNDIRTAAEYALPHRAVNAEVSAATRDQPDKNEDTQQELSAETPPKEENQPQESSIETRDHDTEESTVESVEPPRETSGESSGETPDDIQAGGEAFIIPQWQDSGKRRKANPGNGRRNRVISGNRQGRYVNYRVPAFEKASDIAFDATVRAAAPYQLARDKAGRAIAISSGDLRVKIREKRTGGYILFVVDASASMGANRRMKEVKAAILSLLNVSYQKRDRVALIAFRKEKAELLLGFTRSVELARKRLEQLPTGGRTPLASGLALAFELVMGLKMRDSGAVPAIVLVSDGKANGQRGVNAFAEALREAERIGNRGIDTIVIDTENDYIRFRLCEKLNEKLRGTLVGMEELHSTGIVRAVNALARA